MSENTTESDGARPSREVEQFYDRLGSTEISTGVDSRFDITCPGCAYATEVDPWVWDCEHCDETLALFVGSFASAQNQETEEDCADAIGWDDDRDLCEEINDKMVVIREEVQRDELRSLQNKTGELADRVRAEKPVLAGFLEGVTDDLQEAEQMLLDADCADANGGSDDDQ